MVIKTHENHQRIIQVTFELLDSLLCKLERFAQGQETESLLFEELNPLLEKERQQLLQEIFEIRKLILEVKEDLQLNKSQINIGMLIQGFASTFVENISDLEPTALKAYGPPTKELTDYLNPRIKKFEEALHRIAKIGTIAMQRSTTLR